MLGFRPRFAEIVGGDIWLEAQVLLFVYVGVVATLVGAV